MKQALQLFTVIAAGFIGADWVLGYQAAYSIGYGAIAMMALMISGTFLWLWTARATPLALGMSFSWAGAASVMGWWWMFNILDRPVSMVNHEALFVFLSLYFVGAILHFGVVQRSMGLDAGLFALPVALSVLASTVIYATF